MVCTMSAAADDAARTHHPTTVVWTAGVQDATLGGKAQGLADLARLRLEVPPYFVIANAIGGVLPAEVFEAYRRLNPTIANPTVAVRSSAQGEDGAVHSFAGQYDTVLGVCGVTQLQAAVDRCVQSATSERAAAYSGALGAHVAMNVVVQIMVDAEVAGVVFTADATTGRRDLVVVDAVAGLGDALVSGEAASDHYVLEARDTGFVAIESDVSGEAPLLSGVQLDRLHREALRAAGGRGHPLDLEWAIDRAGRLWWLQARPITTIPGDLNELDTPLPAVDDVFTRGNISEMMPGAVCPLTQSVTGYAMEFGLQHVQIAAGIQRGFQDRWLQIGAFYGHFFLNMTTGTAMSSGIVGNSAEQYSLSACGRVVHELTVEPLKPLPVRLWNTVKISRFTLGAGPAVRDLNRRITDFTMPVTADVPELLAFIDSGIEFYAHAMMVHIRSSGRSAVASNVFEKLVARHAASKGLDEHVTQTRAVTLLSGELGVEGARLVADLDGIVTAIARHPDVAAKFMGVDPEQAVHWLRTHAPDHVSRALAHFLERHGHRGYRELCMRDLAWIDDLGELGRLLQTSASGRIDDYPHHTRTPREHVDEPTVWPRHIRGSAMLARVATRGREQTKSSLVRVAHRLKRALRRLGELLESQGVIPDADLVFFVTREELRSLANEESGLVERAINRRKAFEYQDRLEFPTVSIGKPRPVWGRPAAQTGDGVLAGRVASRGVVEGPVRVALSIDAAAALKPGEILVTAVTDVGWTPYFSIIAGLITDIGSALSHGAVIAREYGLPCVVNTGIATSVLHTGDRVRIDGDKGVVTVCSTDVTLHAPPKG
jgi:pyruvate,water dikinase